MGAFKDLTGEKFERLTVLRKSDDYYVSPKGVKIIKWVCKCDCGNEIETTGNLLKNGNTKSCGCLNTEKRSLLGRNSKKYNVYDLSGEYGIGYTLKNEEFYFDIDDYEQIKEYCWFIDDRGYVLANTFGEKKQKMIQMHRLLMNFPEGRDIDHINHNTKDNRRINLRVCSHSDNQKNIKLSSKNTSGVTGVSWDKYRNSWKVQMQANNEPVKIGRFTNFDDAVKARKEAEEKYFGEYSYDNSMKISDQTNS
mgnify:CR=1 FL=1